MSFDRLRLVWRSGPLDRRRRRPLRSRLRPEAVEHAARLVADLLDHLAREFREPDLAPIGERARMILLAACRGIVARHILAPVARQRPRELALVGDRKSTRLNSSH